jgi:predicted small lipoprotein YifL
MRAFAYAVLLCVLLGACGSKGALVLPAKPDTEQQQSNSSKQNQEPVAK